VSLVTYDYQPLRDRSIRPELYEEIPIPLRISAPGCHALPIAKADREKDHELFNSADFREFRFLEALGFNLRTDFVETYYVPHERNLDKIAHTKTQNYGEVVTLSNGFEKVTKIGRKSLKKHFKRRLANRNHLYSGETTIKPPHGPVRQITENEIALIMQKDGTLGCTHTPGSRVLKIDIDDHDNIGAHSRTAKTALHHVLRDFDYAEPAEQEVSLVNGGFHLALAFDAPVTDVMAKAYEQNFNQRYAAQGLKIEVCTTTKPISLPGSGTYEICRIQNPATLQHTVYPELKAFASLSDAIDHSFEILKRPGISISKLHAYQVEDTSEPERNLFIRDYGAASTAKDLMNDFPITRGNRVGGIKQMIRLAFACHSRKATLETFREASSANNRGSYDLTHWSSGEFAKGTEDIYNWAEERFIPSRRKAPSAFHSNRDRLTPEMRRAVRSHVHEVFRLYCLFERKQNGVWARHTFRALILLAEEMVGKMLFHEEFPIRISPDVTVSMYLRRELTHGFVFDKIFKSLLRDHYRIRVDIFRLFNFLTYRGLFLNQYRVNERGWAHSIPVSFAKQFVILDESDGTIEERILHGLKSATCALANVMSPQDFEIARTRFIKRLVKLRFKQGGLTFPATGPVLGNINTKGSSTIYWSSMLNYLLRSLNSSLSARSQMIESRGVIQYYSSIFSRYSTLYSRVCASHGVRNSS